jgi:hypothetical protein
MPLLAAILIKWLREAETLPYINYGENIPNFGKNVKGGYALRGLGLYP